MPPAAVLQLLAAAPAVGISGSRTPGPFSLAALVSLAACVPASASVLVGDASGIDTSAVRYLPRASVFQVGAYGSPHAPFRAQLAARSIACVQACAAAGGVWCAFPARPAPAGLAPSSRPAVCFGGFGSGTWSSLALALGLGLPAVMFSALPPPRGWGLLPAAPGWFVAAPVARPAAAQQLALF